MASKVMLSVQKCQTLLKTLTLGQRTVKLNQYNYALGRCVSGRHYCSAQQEHSAPQTEEESEEDAEERLRVEEIRDVSRLPDGVRGRLEHRLQPPEIDPDARDPARVACRLYGYYGQASGHDPRVAWPTPEELQEEIEFEREFEPTLQQRWATLKEQKEAELAKRRATEERVEKQMARMPQYITQFKARIAKSEAAERKQEEKRKGLMEEARDYFGFHIDPRDPRFKEMQEMKAAEELQMKKKRKKEEKVIRVESAIKRMQDEADKAKAKEDGPGA